MSADTDMVEKVARAIAHARSWQTTALTVGDWDDRSTGERQPFLEMARAALDASGIGELVEGDLDELRFVLNCSESNMRISTVMRTFTLPDRLTTKEKLERLYAALSRARATVGNGDG